MQRTAGVVVVVCSVLVGCLDEAPTRCTDGTLCPGGQVCVERPDAPAQCVELPAYAACDGLADGAPCTFGDDPRSICRAHVCLVPRCGDGQADPDETCDDGNQVSGDGCAADCRSDETCGNGVTDFGETCDDGNQVPNDGCDPGCGVACKQVNGLKWCYNPAACGQACNAVCAVYGLVPVASAPWFAAQDTPAECQNIGTAFGIPNGVSMNSYTYACAEDSFGSHNGQTFLGPILCSTYNLCPVEHLTNMDQLGVPCSDPGSRRSICPCQ